MKYVVQCVYYIRARGLNHRQFKAFLQYLDCDYPDVVYFSAVRWLSRAATLKRSWNLWQEIKLFMESKHQNVALCHENWLNDLAFLTYITQHLTELNLELQGKSQLVNKLFKHICASVKKLNCFSCIVPHWPISHVLLPGRWNFLILIPPTMQLVLKNYMLSSQAGFQCKKMVLM